MQDDMTAFPVQPPCTSRSNAFGSAGYQYIFFHHTRLMKIILIALLSLLAACNRSSETLHKLPGDAVILAFGDSLTYGTGASPQHDYPSILAKLTTLKVINAGRPGEISGEGVNRLPTLLDQ